MENTYKILPSHVIDIMNVLRQSGFAAYIVGGAVRDLLLGKKPQDYDIATNAYPDNIVRIAHTRKWQVIDKLGHNFGVVMIVIDGHMTEVAAFRGERYGIDSHRPEKVWYTDHIEDDLARRDFTVNAMAMDISGTIIDPFAGQDDLKRKLIRAVGEPHKRFEEDALRMFRACRFAGQLGFSIDKGTYEAIRPHLPRVAGLSMERVRTELEKMLLAPDCHLSLDALVRSGLAGCSCRLKMDGVYRMVAILPELNHLVGLPQNPAYHVYDGWGHTAETVRHTPPELILRWAALLHDVAKGMPGVRGSKSGQPTDYGHDRQGALLASEVLARFQIAPKFISRVVWLIARHMRFCFYLHQNSSVAMRWVRAEARSGSFKNQSELQEAFHQLACLCAADIEAAGHSKEAVKQAAESGRHLCELTKGMPVHTRDLFYSVTDLADALEHRSRIGPFLRIALHRVQDGNLVNEEKAIAAAARKWAARQK